MSWRGELKKAGYDYSKIKDAKEPLFVGTIEKGDLKGAVIGSSTACCGAKLICRSLQAEMAWVGARMAVVVFNKNKIRRYEHNGRIPAKQDAGFFPIGTVMKLRPVSPTLKRGYKANYDATRTDDKRKISNQTRTQRTTTIVGEFRR